jgi:YesN/AraC family two-component response regulator
MKILIVDDEPPARDRLKRLIEELEGCECVGEAGNGTQAITLVSRLAPDVVLLDIRMPGRLRRWATSSSPCARKSSPILCSAPHG